MSAESRKAPLPNKLLEIACEFRCFLACSQGLIGSAPIIIPDGKLYSGDDFFIPPNCAPYVKGVLVPGGCVRDRVQKMAYDIRSHYKQGELHIICVLKGGEAFCSSLSSSIREQECLASSARGLELFHHFLQIRTYRDRVAHGEVKLVADDLPCLKDKDVLVVDDVVESGNTLKHIEKWLRKFEPRSIRAAGLLQVRIKGKMPTVDFVGFTAPAEWFVGYGIDFNDHLREVPHICVLSKAAEKAFAV